MGPFDVARSFIERCLIPKFDRPIEEVFQYSIASLGFPHFACGSHIDPAELAARGGVFVHNFPLEFVRELSRQRPLASPILVHAKRVLLPFFWSSPDLDRDLKERQHQFLDYIRSWGVTDGYTIPIHPPWSLSSQPASCSVVADSGSVDRDSYYAVHLMSGYLFSALTRASSSTSPRPLLTPRERQCLELVAIGLKDREIARRLGISPHTVRRHVESARRRLGTSTRLNAVAMALKRRQIG